MLTKNWEDVQPTCAWPRQTFPRGVVPANRLWHLLQTGPQQEFRAETWLRKRCGLDAYVPKIKKNVAQNFNRRREVTRPMFVGYVLVQLALRVNLWDQMESAPVSLHFVRIHDEPAVLPEMAISAIRKIEADIAGYVPPPPPTPKQGDLVQIVADDLWMGHFARVEHLDDRGRITVLLNLLGRLTPTEVSVKQVRLVESRGTESAAGAKR